MYLQGFCQPRFLSSLYIRFLRFRARARQPDFDHTSVQVFLNHLVHYQETGLINTHPVRARSVSPRDIATSSIVRSLWSDRVHSTDGLLCSRLERCPVLPTSVGHIQGLSGHNGLARDDPMRDVPGQSWDILQPGVHWMSGGSHVGRSGTVLGHPATGC